jgi:hypothetical protein
MKTDIKQLLKELKTNDLKFVDPTDEKLLNKEKIYHLHNKYEVDSDSFTYSYPCLVELETENSKVFNLFRTTQIIKKLEKPVAVDAPSMTVHVEPIVEIKDTKVDTTVVSDAAAKALIGEFLEKNQ